MAHTNSLFFPPTPKTTSLFQTFQKKYMEKVKPLEDKWDARTKFCWQQNSKDCYRSDVFLFLYCTWRSHCKSSQSDVYISLYLKMTFVYITIKAVKSYVSLFYLSYINIYIYIHIFSTLYFSAIFSFWTNIFFIQKVSRIADYMSVYTR